MPDDEVVDPAEQEMYTEESVDHKEHEFVNLCPEEGIDGTLWG